MEDLQEFYDLNSLSIVQMVGKLLYAEGNAIELYHYSFRNLERDKRTDYLEEVILQFSEEALRKEFEIIEDNIQHGDAMFYGKDDIPKYSHDDKRLSPKDYYYFEAHENWLERRKDELTTIFKDANDKLGNHRLTTNGNQSIKINESFPRQQVIEILHEGLVPRFIDVSLEDFQRHFQSNQFSPIIWNNTEVQLKALFDLMLNKGIIESDKINKLIAQHFVNRKGENHTSNRLASMKSRKSYGNILFPEYKKEHPIYRLVQQVLVLKK